MPAQNDALTDRLSRAHEITITVTGRKSGRAISVPVWFVLEDDKLNLLPVQGSDTQWYKNVLENPSFDVRAGSAEAAFDAIPFTEPAEVSRVIEKFRSKYGDDGVKLYSKLDVAVIGRPRESASQ